MKELVVRVCLNAKRACIKEQDGLTKVYTTAPAIEGKANKAIIPPLARYFGVRKSEIEIIKGLKSRDKTIRIYS